MGKNDQQTLIGNYQALKAKLPTPDEMSKFEAVTRQSLSAVAKVREGVLEMLKRGAQPDPKSVLIAIVGEEVIQKARTETIQEWDDISAEVSRMAQELLGNQD
jgi:hypothetical protein